MARRSLAFGAALLASLVACRLLVDSNSAQCARDGDCDGLFPGAGLVCLGSSCVERTASADAGDGGPSCTSNAECMDREAKLSGGAAICVTGGCQPIKVEGVCLPQLLPVTTGRSAVEYLRDDNVIVLGGFVPLRGPNPFADPYVRAHNLALAELNANGGIPDGPNGALRPIVMVLCGAEPDVVDRGTAHLIDDLKVPAVVANWISAADLPRFVAKAAAAGTFTVNPNDTTATLTLQNVKSLAWHLLGSAEDVALTYRPLMEMVERYVLARKGGTTIKVALVANRYPTNEEIANTIQYGPVVTSGDSGTGTALERAVRFNLKSTAANAADADPKFLFVTYDFPRVDRTPNYEEISSKLSDFGPDVIVAVTGSEIDEIVTRVERAMAAKDGGAGNLPVWMLSVSNARPKKLREYLESPVNELPENKRQRFVGVQYAGSSNKPIRDQWFGRMEAAYGADPAADSTSFKATENFYDAIYWLAYGLFAAGPAADPTGNSIKLGIRKLLSGTDVFPGLEAARVLAYRTIRNDQEATFIGALGPRDIAPATGAQFGQGAVYCYQLAGNTIDVQYDRYRYNKQNGGLDKSDEFCFIGTGFP